MFNDITEALYQHDQILDQYDDIDDHFISLDQYLEQANEDQHND